MGANDVPLRPTVRRNQENHPPRRPVVVQIREEAMSPTVEEVWTDFERERFLFSQSVAHAVESIKRGAITWGSALQIAEPLRRYYTMAAFKAIAVRECVSVIINPVTQHHILSVRVDGKYPKQIKTIDKHMKNALMQIWELSNRMTDADNSTLERGADNAIKESFSVLRDFWTTRIIMTSIAESNPEFAGRSTSVESQLLISDDTTIDSLTAKERQLRAENTAEELIKPRLRAVLKKFTTILYLMLTASFCLGAPASLLDCIPETLPTE